MTERKGIFLHPVIFDVSDAVATIPLPVSHLRVFLQIKMGQRIALVLILYKNQLKFIKGLDFLLPFCYTNFTEKSKGDKFA